MNAQTTDIVFYTALSSCGGWIVAAKYENSGLYMLPTRCPYAVMQVTAKENQVKEIADLQRLNCYELYGEGKLAFEVRKFKEAVFECFAPLINWLNKKLGK